MLVVDLIKAASIRAAVLAAVIRPPPPAFTSVSTLPGALLGKVCGGLLHRGLAPPLLLPTLFILRFFDYVDEFLQDVAFVVFATGSAAGSDLGSCHFPNESRLPCNGHP